MRTGNGLGRGFTLLELIVTLAIIGLLVSIATPRVIGALDNAKEASLKSNLAVIRAAIDNHFRDNGVYPSSLEVLVEKRYIRNLPNDPVSDLEAGWTEIKHPAGLPGIYDLRSANTQTGSDGRPYSEW
jgi:general secretion pathway protein G